MEKIKIINEIMQNLKIRMYKADNYDCELEKLTKEYDDLLIGEKILRRTYVISKRRFIILCVLTFGILYKKKKANLYILDQIFEVAYDEINQDIEQLESKIKQLDDDKKHSEQNLKYYKQMDQFLELSRKLDKTEKEKYLNYKM